MSLGEDELSVFTLKMVQCVLIEKFNRSIAQADSPTAQLPSSPHCVIDLEKYMT